jgi:hypothetical protein
MPHADSNNNSYLGLSMKRTLIAAAFAAATLAGSAHAAAINGLVNTGLAAQGQQDTNYALTAVVSDTATGAFGYVSYDNQWPINPWLANDDTSRWITPTAAQGQSLDASANGSYTFHLSFDLTGYNAASAAFSGRFSADNAAEIKLNGTTVATGTGFTSWHDFSAANGFVAGVNSLDFVLTNFAQNGGNPAGLRVEFTESNIAAVPEPETYAMLLAGMGLVGFAARRRKQG